MTITICTARLSYGGPGRLDITRRHANDCNAEGCSSIGDPFAPSKTLWAALHKGTIEPAEYLRRYRHDQDRLERRRVDEALTAVGHSLGLGLADSFRVVGVCFCTDVAHCHRRPWRLSMVARGFLDGGELPAEEQRPAPRLVKPARQGSLF